MKYAHWVYLNHSEQQQFFKDILNPAVLQKFKLYSSVFKSLNRQKPQSYKKFDCCGTAQISSTEEGHLWVDPQNGPSEIHGSGVNDANAVWPWEYEVWQLFE